MARLPPALSPATASRTRIDIEGISMLCDVERGRVCLFNRYRVTMFGGTVVIEKHDRCVGSNCQLSD